MHSISSKVIVHHFAQTWRSLLCLRSPKFWKRSTAEPQPTESCHAEPFAVILSAAKNPGISAQGKLREASACKAQGESRFFATLRMTRSQILIRKQEVIPLQYQVAARAVHFSSYDYAAAYLGRYTTYAEDCAEWGWASGSYAGEGRKWHAFGNAE